VKEARKEGRKEVRRVSKKEGGMSGKGGRE
jgi:hypothetical protein